MGKLVTLPTVLPKNFEVKGEIKEKNSTPKSI